MTLQIQRGGSSGSSGSTGPRANGLSDLSDDANALFQPDASNILYRVSFSRYKLGSPVLYMLKVEVSRVLPPLVGAGGEMQESRAAPLGFWTVKKRYSEMQKFHDAISKQFGSSLILPDFPPKNWTNALFNSETQVQKRLRALQIYFDKVLMHAQIRASPDLQTLLEIEVPEQLPSFRVCSFGIHSAEQVFAVCEVSDGNASTGMTARESTGSAGGGSGRPKTGKPVLFFHLTIRRIVQLNFSSESSIFVREDLLENAGRSMRFNLVLGPPEQSYEISIGVSNYKGRNSGAALRIRVLAPSLEDILSEAGNSPQQVDELMKRICSASSRARSSITSGPPGAGSADNRVPGPENDPEKQSARGSSARKRRSARSGHTKTNGSSRRMNNSGQQQHGSSSRGHGRGGGRAEGVERPASSRGGHETRGATTPGSVVSDRVSHSSQSSSSSSSMGTAKVARRSTGAGSRSSGSYVGFGGARQSQVSSAGFECHTDSD